jgi:hypothetical protein
MLTINKSVDLVATLTPLISSLGHAHISRLSWNFKMGIIKLPLKGLHNGDDGGDLKARGLCS